MFSLSVGGILGLDGFRLSLTVACVGRGRYQNPDIEAYTVEYVSRR